MSRPNLEMNDSGGRELTDQELTQIQGGNIFSDTLAWIKGTLLPTPKLPVQRPLPRPSAWIFF